MTRLLNLSISRWMYKEMISHQFHWSIFHWCFKVLQKHCRRRRWIRVLRRHTRKKSLFDVNAFWLEVSCSKLSSSLPFYSTNYRSFIKNHEKVTKLYQLLKSWRRRRLTNENVVQCRPKVRIHPNYKHVQWHVKFLNQKNIW